MKDDTNRYWKHLSLQDRYDIEEGLNSSHTLASIAELLGKDPSTISKEIRKHRIGDSLHTSRGNDCAFRYRCLVKHLCPDCLRDIECRSCRKTECRSHCDRYQSDACKSILQIPVDRYIHSEISGIAIPV